MYIQGVAGGKCSESLSPSHTHGLPTAHRLTAVRRGPASIPLAHCHRPDIAPIKKGLHKEGPLLSYDFFS